MTTFRRGKIARLPRPVREELNRRLDEEPGTGRAKVPAPEAGTRVEPGESNQIKVNQSKSNQKSKGRGNGPEASGVSRGSARSIPPAEEDTRSGFFRRSGCLLEKGGAAVMLRPVQLRWRRRRTITDPAGAAPEI